MEIEMIIFLQIHFIEDSKKNKNKKKTPYCSTTDLSAVGEVVDGHAAVQAQCQPKVTQAAGQVALHQDVGALEVSVHDGHLKEQQHTGSASLPLTPSASCNSAVTYDQYGKELGEYIRDLLHILYFHQFKANF